MTTTASSALETSVAPLLEAGAAALGDQLGIEVQATLGPTELSEETFAGAVSFEGAGSGVYLVDGAVLAAVDGAPAAGDEAAAWVLENIITPLATGAASVLAQLTGPNRRADARRAG